MPGGSAQSRVLQASGADVAHGHLDGIAGTTRYGAATLVPTQPATVSSNTAWVGTCVRSGGLRTWVNGALVDAPSGSTGALAATLGALVVNGGSAFNASQGSDAWAVAEVIIWARQLSDDDIELLDFLHFDATYGLPTFTCTATCTTGTYYASIGDYGSNTCTSCPAGSTSNGAGLCRYGVGGWGNGPATQACFSPQFPDAQVASSTFATLSAQPMSLALSPDGTTLAVALAGVINDQILPTLLLLNAATGAVVASTNMTGAIQVYSVAASAAGFFVGVLVSAGPSVEGVLKFTPAGALVGSISSAGLRTPFALAADAAGNVFVGHGSTGGLTVITAGGTQTDKDSYSDLHMPACYSMKVASLALSDDGHTLFATDNNQPGPVNSVVWAVDLSSSTWATTQLAGRDVTDVTLTEQLQFVDGPARSAAFISLYGLSYASGVLYSFDYFNMAMRAINATDGSVSTLLTYGEYSLPGASPLYGAMAVAAASATKLYIIRNTGAYLVDLVSATYPSPPPSPPSPPPPSPPPPSPPPSPPPPSPPDTTTALYLSTTLSLAGYSTATFGTAEAGGFCVVVLNATSTANCTVTGTSAAARRRLHAAGDVVVAYAVQTTPAASATVSAALLAPGVLDSAAAFRAAGLAACTAATPSTSAPVVSRVPPVASTTLPLTSFDSPAGRAQPRGTAALLAAAAAVLLAA